MAKKMFGRNFFYVFDCEDLDGVRYAVVETISNDYNLKATFDVPCIKCVVALATVQDAKKYANYLNKKYGSNIYYPIDGTKPICIAYREEIDNEPEEDI